MYVTYGLAHRLSGQVFERGHGINKSSVKKYWSNPLFGRHPIS
jgi:hypothetical protein